MTKYNVIITTKVQKYLDKLSDKIADKLETAMLQLGDNPRPNGVDKLTNRDAYRIRVGDYRIIYTIRDKTLLVTVIDTGHRREIYKK